MNAGALKVCTALTARRGGRCGALQAKLVIMKGRGNVVLCRLPVKTTAGEYRIAEILASKPADAKSDKLRYYVHYLECTSPAPAAWLGRKKIRT